MITHDLSVSRETFAADRKKVLTDAADQLRPHVAEAIRRVGLPSWQHPVVNAALDIFDATARAEVDAWSQPLDDLRAAFAHELGEALAKTKPAPAEQQANQLSVVTSWIAQMAHNAAVEAATSTDPDTRVGLEWVTMHDAGVRSLHRETDGQTVPSGHEFSVGGEKLLYPGQPVGDPSVWINCRCLARPTLLSDAAGKTLTAAADPDDGPIPATVDLNDVDRQFLKEMIPHHQMALVMADKVADGGQDPFVKKFVAAMRADQAGEITIMEQLLKEDHPPAHAAETAEFAGKQVFTSATIMALPAESDPVTAASSEPDGAHATLLFLGDTTALDKDALTAALAQMVEREKPAAFTDTVSGRATLGAGDADVVLLDGAGLVALRTALLAQDTIAEAWNAVEQFPTFIPHVTLGYPDTPAADQFSGDSIHFDRIALWFGEDRSTIYPLGGNPVTEQTAAVIHAEDEAFTQEMADAVFADGGAEAGPAPVDQGQVPTEVKWHGVLAPEGVPSGDGRQFANGALTHRDLPLPLKAQFVDEDGHKGSVVVGRIDNIFRDGNLMKASGVFDDSPEAVKAHGMLARKMWRGVSVDVDSAEISAMAAEDGAPDITEFSAARIASATMCAIPAFAEAYVALGDFSVQQGIDEEPMPPLPEHMAAGTETMTSVSLVASAAPALSADLFRDPQLTGPTPLNVTEDGRVFGHLATFDTCHIGYEVCTTAPTSATNYAYFLTGEVFTDAGPVPVGQITMGGGHAAGNKGVRGAMAHYDSTSTAVADVTVGEDEFGIWVAGALREGVSEADVRSLRAAAISGDWREVRVAGSSNFELVAALAVNVPGFPIPRAKATYSNGKQTALVAAGVVTAGKQGLDPEFVAQMEQYTAMQQRASQAAELKLAARTKQAAILKKKINSIGGK